MNHLLSMIHQRGFTAGGFQPMSLGSQRHPGLALDAMLRGRGALGNPMDLHRLAHAHGNAQNGLLRLLSAG